MNAKRILDEVGLVEKDQCDQNDQNDQNKQSNQKGQKDRNHQSDSWWCCICNGTGLTMIVVLAIFLLAVVLLFNGPTKQNAIDPQLINTAVDLLKKGNAQWVILTSDGTQYKIEPITNNPKN